MMKRKIVTLSGSLRFWNEILSVACTLSADGIIILVPFKDPRGDDLPEEAKIMHDKLHHQRIDMSDELYVVNARDYTGDNYIGNSTRDEILYAMKSNKPITFMNRPGLDTWLGILNEVSADDVIPYITPTVDALVDAIIDAGMKYHKLKNTSGFNYITMAEEIRKNQIVLRNLIDAASQRLNVDMSEWPCTYINSSDEFGSPMNTLIYATPAELIEIMPSLKLIMNMASPMKSEFVFNKLSSDETKKRYSSIEEDTSIKESEE